MTITALKPGRWIRIDDLRHPVTREAVRRHTIAEANRHLRAYRETENTVHFCRAWLILRDSGIGVSESFLKKVDTIARQLLDASGQREIAEAVGMTRPKGGGNGVAKADAYLSRREIMADLWRSACAEAGAIPEAGLKPSVSNAVLGEVAARNGLEQRALSQRWYRWWKNAADDERERVYQHLTDALRGP